jgi:hypothetical protein
MFHFHFWPQLLCFRQKSTDPGICSSKHPFCCLSLLVSLGTNHSGIVLYWCSFRASSLWFSVWIVLSEIWDWSCAMVLIDLLIGTGWRKVCSTVSNLPLSLSIKNAWERWLSMVLWSHSSLTERGQLDSSLHWCWTRFVYCGLWLPGMPLHISKATCTWKLIGFLSLNV